MDREEFKKLIYSEFQKGATFEEVKAKYKNYGIPRAGSVISGCYSYFNANKDVGIKDTYKKQAISVADELIETLDVLLSKLETNMNIERSAIEYIENKLLHNFEKDLNELEYLDLAIKLADVRKKRRSLKQTFELKEQFEKGISRASCNEDVRILKNNLLKKRDQIKSVSGEQISSTYERKLDKIKDECIKRKILDFEKELNIKKC